MKARIRYGNEADILQVVASNSFAFKREHPDFNFDGLRAVGITALSFSASVGDIPDMPAFDNILQNLGIQTNQLPSLENNDPTVKLSGAQAAVFGEDAYLLPSVIKTVEVTNPEEIGIDCLKALAHGLFDLADEFGAANDGILFIDHTVVPQGDVIAIHS
jgi:hypothetical protein